MRQYFERMDPIGRELTENERKRMEENVALIEKEEAIVEEAKEKKIILSHGVSCHSLPALKLAAKLDWVDVNLVRINPQGVWIDTMGTRARPATAPPPRPAA